MVPATSHIRSVSVDNIDVTRNSEALPYFSAKPRQDVYLDDCGTVDRTLALISGGDDVGFEFWNTRAG